MTRTSALRLLFLAPLLLALTLAVAPAQADGLALPVQCELGEETVLAWDDIAYDLRGTCGVVRVTADGATVTMPSATRLVVEGAANTVTAKPLADLEVLGPDVTVTTPSVGHVSVSGSGSRIEVEGLVEHAELTGTSTVLSADTVNALRLRGSDTVIARKSFRTRITGSGNVLRLARSDRLVLTGDRNAVTVARGRTTLRDRGEDNVLDLRPRRRR
ncbi:hypothetical protein GCM10009641_84150 [Mycobacterium cookii]|uniref:hypothetical protein n=1 Tax=Nocardioides furvisabuli TaxID=375542 RepID=UPI001E579050|nr:hypothetical protein [Nocardioides furvisabuli]